MSLDLKEKVVPGRRYVRAAHLLNGGLYRPRSNAHRGRHRGPSFGQRSLNRIGEVFAWDARLLAGFYALLAIGAVCVLIAALMLAAFAPTPAGWRLLFAGVFLWTLSALFFGFVYLDPSPDE